MLESSCRQGGVRHDTRADGPCSTRDGRFTNARPGLYIVANHRTRTAVRAEIASLAATIEETLDLLRRRL
jgi:hypothetical protein